MALRQSNAPKKGSVDMALMREVTLPKHIVALLSAMGLSLPGNIKEIDTPVLESDETEQIIIPRGMNKQEAAIELKRQWENEETTTDFVAKFEGWDPFDVLVVTRRVTEQSFGWVNGQSTWWGGDPTEIDVVVDVIKGKAVNEKAFMGNFKITPWESANCAINIERSGVAYISINAKKKYSQVITNYFNKIRTALEQNSIYRARHVYVQWKGEKLNFEIQENKGSDKIVLNHDEELVIQEFILPAMEEEGKRCYLFAGGYGTGKTETAMRLGREATEKGMTFFYLKNSERFPELMELAKRYQPCVIFMEDLDQIASGEERDKRINTILNTLDGFSSKGNNITVIFTTNHPESIASPLRRPGRIDIMLKFSETEEDTRIKIMKAWFDGKPGADTVDYKYLSSRIGQVSGAVVAEICKRCILRLKERKTLSTELVEGCIVSMKFHNELMKERATTEDKKETFFNLLGQLISEGVFSSDTGKKLTEDIALVRDSVV